MFERFTKFDEVRGCYVLKPNVYQGKHIQRLGRCEDIGSKLIEMEYIKDVQGERTDVKDFCAVVNEIIRQAKELKEEKVHE